MVSATFKSALENSGIELPRLQIIDHNIGYFGFTNDISNDLSKFGFTYTSQLRQLYNSDREMLLAPAAWGSTYGRVNCIPYHTSSGYNTNCKAGVADWNTTLGPVWTYAHELGHLFGGRHTPLNNNDLPSCAHAYTFNTNSPNGEDRTLMANFNTSNPNHGSILYFSEPGKYYNGYEIGQSNRNNKTMVNSIICTYTTLRDGNQEMNITPPNTKRSSLSYTNPVIDLLQLSFSDLVKEITIRTLTGKVVKRVQVSVNELTINMSNFPKGLYFLSAKHNQNIETVKIIKL